LNMAKKATTPELIELICKAATEQYPDDVWKPGVQVAHIPEQSGKPACWYVALHRYPRKVTDPIAGERFAPGRHVQAKVKHEDLDEALTELAHALLPPKRDALEDLAEAVGVKL